mgnify:CR=1 FL=1
MNRIVGVTILRHIFSFVVVDGRQETMAVSSLLQRIQHRVIQNDTSTTTINVKHSIGAYNHVTISGQCAFEATNLVAWQCITI